MHMSKNRHMEGATEEWDAYRERFARVCKNLGTGRQSDYIFLSFCLAKTHWVINKQRDCGYIFF